jgi:hypothetical protein
MQPSIPSGLAETRAVWLKTQSLFGILMKIFDDKKTLTIAQKMIIIYELRTDYHSSTNDFELGIPRARVSNHKLSAHSVS